MLLFVGWNGWSLWLFGRHETGLLPGQATQAMIEEGPYRLSRNPRYVGLLASYLGVALLVPTFWGLLLFPVAVPLVLWGAVLPEEQFLHERFRCGVRRLRAAGAPLALRRARERRGTTGGRRRAAPSASRRRVSA